MVGGFSILLWIGAILCWIAYGIQYSNDHASSLDNVWRWGLLPGLLVVGVGVGRVVRVSTVMQGLPWAKHWAGVRGLPLTNHCISWRKSITSPGIK